MNIGVREVSNWATPYVIAELGVNHDGSVTRALEMTRAAKSAGADAVKLQWFRAEGLMSRAARLAEYQRDAGESDPASMLARLELTPDEMARVVDCAHDLGLHAIVTVFSVELVEPAARLAWDAFKSASPDVVHRPLLEAISASGRPLIVSTGAATLGEVCRALGWLGSAQDRLALLQCVSSYPTKDEDAALGGIDALREVFAGPVGYSDHTAHALSGAWATRRGAAILEKHFTYSRAAKGPDHAASLEAAQFAEYVRAARAASGPAVGAGGVTEAAPAHALGPLEKRVLECERDVRQVSRQSIVLTRAVAAGEALDAAALGFKRPGTGIEPWRAAECVGRRAARDLDADELLREEDLR